MAENQFPSTVEALFKGMEHFVTTKTVVGEAVKVDEHTIIIPLVDVTCGMAVSYTHLDVYKRQQQGCGGSGRNVFL